MLKAGFWETEITPPLGCFIPGYYTPRFAEGVRDKLYAKAIAVSDGENTVAMMCVEAIGISIELTEKIIARASSYSGVPADNISVSSTHTHTGLPCEDDELEDKEYNEMLIRLGGDCIANAVQHMEEVNIKFGKGYVDSIAFNRVYKMKDGKYQTAPEIGDEGVLEPSGPIDPELCVLYIEDSEGNAKGAVINYACHPDVVKGSKFSGDWPSILSYEMKDKFGRDFVSLFVNGACGNINHVDVMNAKDYPPSEHYIKMGKIVAKEAISAIASAKEINGSEVKAKKEYLKIKSGEFDPEKLAEAKHLNETVELKISDEPLALGAGDQLMADLIIAKKLLKFYDERTEYGKLCVQAIKIGDVYFYAMPGEPFVQFGLQIKANSPSEKNIIAEISNGPAGYLPLEDMFFDSVYESRRTSAYYEKKAGEIVTNRILELAKEL